MSTDRRFAPLLASLGRRPSSGTVKNPYLDPRTLGNLALYLEYMHKHRPRTLLVGEAPGYKGCKVTGIPFTSGKVILAGGNELFRSISGALFLPKILAENTATIVWSTLGDIAELPLFWNAFPYHPHPAGNPDGNRAPTSDEVAEGREHLEFMVQAFSPMVLGGVGKSGMKALQALPLQTEPAYLRHPSFGGKSDFVRAIKRLLKS